MGFEEKSPLQPRLFHSWPARRERERERERNLSEVGLIDCRSSPIRSSSKRRENGGIVLLQEALGGLEGVLGGAILVPGELHQIHRPRQASPLLVRLRRRRVHRFRSCSWPHSEDSEGSSELRGYWKCAWGSDHSWFYLEIFKELAWCWTILCSRGGVWLDLWTGNCQPLVTTLPIGYHGCTSQVLGVVGEQNRRSLRT